MKIPLTAEFDRIRALYFPEWEEGDSWRVQESECNGYCDRQTKTIKIGKVTENYSLPVLLIHEIAHAVTIPSHDIVWIERMHEAERRAVELDDHNLAGELQKHIEWVADGYDVTDDEVYDEIVFAARDCPDADFEKVASMVAKGYGLDLETFLNDFPKARETFESTR